MIERWRAVRLSAELGRRLGGRPPPLRPGGLVGLEHEYAVRRRSDGRRVDFAQLVHRLRPSTRGLDPTDGNAYWLPSGTLLTADEQEAELALPPTASRPGFSWRLDARMGAAESWLADAIAPDMELVEGVSTHISVSIGGADGARLAERYARRWAPAMMLLLDGRDSPGLLVRPRPGRLELCGEYVSADDRRAAAIFALGSTLSCLAESSRLGLPALRLRLRLGDQRYGWYVDRRAPGADLYAAGRATPLMTIEGSTRSAGEHLAEAWAVARRHLVGRATRDEMDLVDRLVTGRAALPVERKADTGRPRPGRDGAVTVDSAVERSVFGRALEARHRSRYDVAPVMLTWQVAVFVVASHAEGRRAFAVIPARLLGRWLRRLDAGLFDDVIEAYLRLRPAHRLLAAHRDTRRAGLFDALSVRPALLAPEHPVINPGAAA